MPRKPRPVEPSNLLLCVPYIDDGQQRCKNCFIYFTGKPDYCKVKVIVPPKETREKRQKVSEVIRVLPNKTEHEKAAMQLENLGLEPKQYLVPPRVSNEQAGVAEMAYAPPISDIQTSVPNRGEVENAASRAAPCEGSNPSPGTSLHSWQIGLCERIAQGDGVAAILKDYAINHAKFIEERDSNAAFREKLDAAFKITAEMAEYHILHLALVGSPAERKAYTPMLLAKHGGKKLQEGESSDPPSGKEEGM